MRGDSTSALTLKTLVAGRGVLLATLYERPPRACPNGHPWTRGAFLVGWDNGRQPSPCRVWICKTCDAAIYNDGVSP